MTKTRIDARFAALKQEGRPALVTYVQSGDPDYETSVKILNALPAAGADVIELGMPFSDPMADGPAVQLSAQRALANGQTMEKTLTLVRQFREQDQETPIVLMGYYNPIYIYGNERFLKDAKEAGVDGLIIVDMPPEADDELCLPAMKHGISFIRLATPTTDEKRLPAVLNNTSGFVYYVTITGTTGTATPDPQTVSDAITHIKRSTDLPIVAGFGVKNAKHAETIGRGADGVAVGSAIVNAIRDSIDSDGKATDGTVHAVVSLVRELADGVKRAAS